MERINSSKILSDLTRSTQCSFSNSIIEDDLIIDSYLKIDKLIFINCEFKGVFKIIYDHGSRITISIGLENSVFNEIVEIKLFNSFNSYINCTKSNFKKNFKFSATSSELTSFNGNELKFGNIFDISGTHFQTLLLENVASYGEDKLENFISNNINVIGDCSFKESIMPICDFKDSKFNSKLNLDRLKSYSLYFYNANFNNDVYCNNSNFGKYAIFNGSTFLGKFVAPFLNEETQECIGDFSGCTFDKKSFFDYSKFKKVIFKNTSFNEIVSFSECDFYEIDFQRTLFQNSTDFSYTKFSKGDRESFRLIKNELQKSGNRVEAIYYQAKELIEYEKNATGAEKIMLFLNRISNEHGLNWVKGIIFTFITSVIFYSTYIFSLPEKPFKWGYINFAEFSTAISTITKYYFIFLSVVHNYDFVKNANPNGLSLFLDFLGRIFIGYGIYQTIQAFRKYGKK
jgi:hypothetical protein